ncbi:MAG TPA: tripartite tricarboxylate transporter substrate binding protein [Usitatibacter sp.]|nr:tripartite tricarboxylate transporter substrate binding protein [Usitatibacter sp.]
MSKLRASIIGGIAAVAMLASALASAQQWPTKPVKIISVFPPGGSVDQVARILAQQLQVQLGQTFIVENRTGAAGSIGTQVVASSAPDGYTFGVVFDTHAVNPLLIPGISFDTLKDLAPVMLVGTSPMAIVTQANAPYKDFRDVIAAAKARPGSLSMGSIGTGSLGHLALAQIDKALGIDITHIPYRGGGPLMVDAVGGQVPLAIGSVFLVSPHVKGGKMKALAVTSLKPTPQLPGAAPLAEQGMPGFEALSWWGIIAPANTPQPIIRKMVDELGKALKDPSVAEKLTAQGIDLNGGGPEVLDKFVRSEMARWAAVVKENNIRAGD